MWDPDSTIVYALSRRLPPIKYVVPYHVNDYSSINDVAKQISESLPKFIITTSNQPFAEIRPTLLNHYILIAQVENADIWSRIGQ